MNPTFNHPMNTPLIITASTHCKTATERAALLAAPSFGRVFTDHMVVIPYRDAALNQHLGRSSDPITQAEVYKGITARTEVEAIKKALSQFLQSNVSLQFSVNAKNAESGRRVEVLEAYLVGSPAQ